MVSDSSAPDDLAHRLDRNRRRFFVGRRAEKEALETFITAPFNNPGLVAHLIAPGGVGKTTLLKALLQDTRYAHPVLWLDARDVPPNPGILAGAVQAQRHRHQVEPTQPHLLVIDTFEHLAPLESWLREEFLPAQSLGFRLILSGRSEPALEWRTDPVWVDEHRRVTLSPFSVAETEEYLSLRGVLAASFDNARQFARGNPLALALFTDSISQHENISGSLAQSWRQRLVNNLDDQDQRAALEACCVVRQLDEPMLASLLQRDEATTLFNWLASQSYIETGNTGVFPHDLLRQAFTDELKQRRPSRLTELGDRAFTYIHDLLEHAMEDRLGLIQDAFYVLRDIDIQQNMNESDPVDVYVDRVRPSDWPAIDDMIRRFEHDQRIELVHRLHDCQPESLTVVRDSTDRAIGFFQILRVDLLPASLLDADPVCAQFLSLAREAMNHQGTVILNRFWLHHDQDMAATAVYTQAFSQLAFMSVSATPAVMGSVQGDTPEWRQAQARFGHSEARIDTPERRGTPVMFIYQDLSADTRAGINWLRQAYRHAFGLVELLNSPATDIASLPDQKTFQTALRQAFRSATRLDRLQTNALLDCKLLSQRGQDTDPVTRAQDLRHRLEATCERLEAQTTTRDHGRVLQLTYLRPAPTQQVAAERLALSYATYRRRLTEALKLVESEWWAEELVLREH
jgi:hypothetical protein